jgi:hypothetical protein
LVPGEFGGHLGYGVLTLGGGGHRESFTIGGYMLNDEDSVGFDTESLLKVTLNFRCSQESAPHSLQSVSHLLTVDDQGILALTRLCKPAFIPEQAAEVSYILILLF